MGLFHLPVSSAEVIEPFKAIPFKVWACNFCSLSKNENWSIPSFYSFLFQLQMIRPLTSVDSQSSASSWPSSSSSFSKLSIAQSSEYEA